MVFDAEQGHVLHVRARLHRASERAAQVHHATTAPFLAQPRGQIRNVIGGWESDYSFPSSHSQTLASFCMAFVIKYEPTLIVQLALAALVAMVSLARVYLGVHMFSDIIAGCTIGLLVPLALTERDVMHWFAMHEAREQIMIAAALPVFCYSVLALARWLVRGPSAQQIAVWEKQAHTSETSPSSNNLKLRALAKYHFQICKQPEPSSLLDCFVCAQGVWLEVLLHFAQLYAMLSCGSCSSSTMSAT